MVTTSYTAVPGQTYSSPTNQQYFGQQPTQQSVDTTRKKIVYDKKKKEAAKKYKVSSRNNQQTQSNINKDFFVPTTTYKAVPGQTYSLPNTDFATYTTPKKNVKTYSEPKKDFFVPTQIKIPKKVVKTYEAVPGQTYSSPTNTKTTKYDPAQAFFNKPTNIKLDVGNKPRISGRDAMMSGQSSISSSPTMPAVDVDFASSNLGYDLNL